PEVGEKEEMVSAVPARCMEMMFPTASYLYSAAVAVACEITQAARSNTKKQNNNNFFIFMLHGFKDHVVAPEIQPLRISQSVAPSSTISWNCLSKVWVICGSYVIRVTGSLA
ncbi:MAG: hypothetical protein FWC42_08215, partial [Proteobacteria bacterium]|nr:hypothetical protein [Pseudomonadota bacterium]